MTSTSGTSLNVACRFRHLPGQLTLDRHGGDIVGDMRHLPIRTATISHVDLIHAIEHVSIHDAIQVLGECHRILKPGGTLTVEGPDVEKCFAYYAGKPRELIRALYGDPTGTPEDVHRWGWTAQMLWDVCLRIGFRHGTTRSATAHGRPGRDYRVDVTK